MCSQCVLQYFLLVHCCHSQFAAGAGDASYSFNTNRPKERKEEKKKDLRQWEVSSKFSDKSFDDVLSIRTYTHIVEHIERKWVIDFAVKLWRDAKKPVIDRGYI